MNQGSERVTCAGLDEIGHALSKQLVRVENNDG